MAGKAAKAANFCGITPRRRPVNNWPRRRSILFISRVSALPDYRRKRDWPSAPGCVPARWSGAHGRCGGARSGSEGGAGVTLAAQLIASFVLSRYLGDPFDGREDQLGLDPPAHRAGGSAPTPAGRSVPRPSSPSSRTPARRLPGPPAVGPRTRGTGSPPARSTATGRPSACGARSPCPARTAGG